MQMHVAGGVDTVTLLQGQVVVAADRKRGDAGRVTLNPGERVALGADGRLGTLEHLPETELASAQGWTAGMLVVREWPLARLVAVMNRNTETTRRLGIGQAAVRGSMCKYNGILGERRTR